jgi:hypothetical protein
MFYVGGDNFIWWRSFESGESGRYSLNALNIIFNTTSYFTLRPNGVLNGILHFVYSNITVVLVYAAENSTIQYYQLWDIPDITNPFATMFFSNVGGLGIIRTVTCSPNSGLLWFGTTNGQVVSLNLGNGFITGVISGWPSSFPNVEINTDKFITFSQNGNIIYTSATFPNQTVFLLTVDLTSSNYIFTRPYPGIMDFGWNTFTDVIFYSMVFIQSFIYII